MASAIGPDEAAVRLLLRKLARLGRVHQVVRDLFYLDASVRQLLAMLLQMTDDNPLIQATGFRDKVGIRRKRSIQPFNREWFSA